MSSQGDTCPSFGTEFPRGHDTSNEQLWLNFDTPSQCTGTAVEWRFCYHYTNARVQAILRVYRRIGVNSYERVVDNVIDRDYRNGGADTPCVDSNNYCCETLSISERIEKNDIIGVCMRNTGSRDPLYVLDEEPPPGYSLYEHPAGNCHGGGGIPNFMETDLNSSPEMFGLHAFLGVTGKKTVEFQWLKSVLIIILCMYMCIIEY